MARYLEYKKVRNFAEYRCSKVTINCNESYPSEIIDKVSDIVKDLDITWTAEFDKNKYAVTIYMKDKTTLSFVAVSVN